MRRGGGGGGRRRGLQRVPGVARRLAAAAVLLAPLPFAPLLLAVPVPAAAQPALDSIIPPSPAPASFIADGGPVLDDSARARLDERIATVQRTTGGDIGVLILRDLHDRAPVDVAVATYRDWKIGRVDSLGSARRNLGAILLIVPKELAPNGRGECWITTGTGAEGELRDADAGTICRDRVIPHLRERDYEAAIAAGVDGIAEAFQATVAGIDAPGVVGSAARGGRNRERNRTVGAWLLGGFLTVTGIPLLIVLERRRRRRKPRPCPRGHGMMVRLSEAADDAELTPGQRTEEKVGSIDYDVWACPLCDERLVIPYRRWSSYEACPKCGNRTVKKTSRTITAATTMSTGLEEITLACAFCDWRDVTRRTTPRISTSSGSSGGGSSGGGSSHSFGGSGSTSGGGGGGSY